METMKPDSTMRVQNRGNDAMDASALTEYPKISASLACLSRTAMIASQPPESNAALQLSTQPTRGGETTCRRWRDTTRVTDTAHVAGTLPHIFAPSTSSDKTDGAYTRGRQATAAEPGSVCPGCASTLIIVDACNGTRDGAPQAVRRTLGGTRQRGAATLPSPTTNDFQIASAPPVQRLPAVA